MQDKLHNSSWKHANITHVVALVSDWHFISQIANTLFGSIQPPPNISAIWLRGAPMRTKTPETTHRLELRKHTHTYTHMVDKTKNPREDSLHSMSRISRHLLTIQTASWKNYNTEYTCIRTSDTIEQIYFCVFFMVLIFTYRVRYGGRIAESHTMVSRCSKDGGSCSSMRDFRWNRWHRGLFSWEQRFILFGQAPSCARGLKGWPKDRVVWQVAVWFDMCVLKCFSILSHRLVGHFSASPSDWRRFCLTLWVHTIRPHCLDWPVSASQSRSAWLGMLLRQEAVHQHDKDKPINSTSCRDRPQQQLRNFDKRLERKGVHIYVIEDRTILMSGGGVRRKTHKCCGWDECQVMCRSRTSTTNVYLV